MYFIILVTNDIELVTKIKRINNLKKCSFF